MDPSPKTHDEIEFYILKNFLSYQTGQIKSRIAETFLERNKKQETFDLRLGTELVGWLQWNVPFTVPNILEKEKPQMGTFQIIFCDLLYVIPKF